MRRAVLWTVLGLLATAGFLEAQTTGINDQEIQRFVLPGTNTTGQRVHASRSHMSLALPKGNIIAAGGYKIAYAFAHTGNIVVNTTDTVMPIAGTASPSSSGAGGAAGINYQRVPYEGSIIAVTIGLSEALTAGTITAEATIRRSDSTVYPTGLSAVAQLDRQFAIATQARGRSVFNDAEGVGCRLTVTAAALPVSAEAVCTIVVEY